MAMSANKMDPFIYPCQIQTAWVGLVHTQWCHTYTFLFLSPPSSKCLHLFRETCFLLWHLVHSILRTTFFVVLAWDPVERGGGREGRRERGERGNGGREGDHDLQQGLRREGLSIPSS